MKSSIVCASVWSHSHSVGNDSWTLVSLSLKCLLGWLQWCYLEETWTIWQSRAAASHRVCWDCWGEGGEALVASCRSQSRPPVAQCPPECWSSAGTAAAHGWLVYRAGRTQFEHQPVGLTDPETSVMDSTPWPSNLQTASSYGLKHTNAL